MRDFCTGYSGHVCDLAGGFKWRNKERGYISQSGGSCFFNSSGSWFNKCEKLKANALEAGEILNLYPGAFCPSENSSSLLSLVLKASVIEFKSSKRFFRPLS